MDPPRHGEEGQDEGNKGLISVSESVSTSSSVSVAVVSSSKEEGATVVEEQSSTTTSTKMRREEEEGKDDGGMPPRIPTLMQLFPEHPFIERVKTCEKTRAAIEAMDVLAFARLLSALKDFRPARKRTLEIQSFDQVVQLIRNSRKILVLTGAGISTSCGIPDFRSKDGVYATCGFKLKEPQDLFSIHYFRRNVKPFYDFARKLWPGTHKPAPTHLFIKKLEDLSLLSRNYSQNIDTLEFVAGVSRVIQCHGSFATATCTRCKFRCPGSNIKHDIMNQTPPLCPKCIENPKPSLMVEFAMKDPVMGAFRMAGARSFSISSESDCENDSPRAVATSTPKNAIRNVENNSSSNLADRNNKLISSSNIGSDSKSSSSSSNATSTMMMDDHKGGFNSLASSPVKPLPFQPPSSSSSQSSLSSQDSVDRNNNNNNGSASLERKPSLTLITASSPTHGNRYHEPDSPFTSSAKRIYGNQHRNFPRSDSLASSDAPTTTGEGFPPSPVFGHGTQIPQFMLEPKEAGIMQRARSHSLGDDVGSQYSAASANVGVGSNGGGGVGMNSSSSSSSSSQDIVVSGDNDDGIGMIKDEKEIALLKKLSREVGDLPTNPSPVPLPLPPPPHTQQQQEEGEQQQQNAMDLDDQAQLERKPSLAISEPGDNPTSTNNHSNHSSSSNTNNNKISSAASVSSMSSGHSSVGNAAEESSRARARLGLMDEEGLPFVDPIYDRGVLKPDIVFFGESLPSEFFDCIEKDVESCDLVLILGTSLKVAPVSRIIEMVDPKIPQVLINRELVAQPHQFDVELLGNCDNVVMALAKALGWELEENKTDLELDFAQSEHQSHRFLFHGAMEDDVEEEQDDDDDGDGHTNVSVSPNNAKAEESHQAGRQEDNDSADLDQTHDDETKEETLSSTSSTKRELDNKTNEDQEEPKRPKIN